MHILCIIYRYIHVHVAILLLLFQRFSGVTERGHFRCELPNAADPSVNQILYVNICEFVTRLVCANNYIMLPINIIPTANFGINFDVDHVTFSGSSWEERLLSDMLINSL